MVKKTLRQIIISIDQSSTLLDQLRNQGYYILAPCGGRGTCGGCRVRFASHAPDPSSYDRESFSGKELEEGWRLACGTVAEGRFELQLPEVQENGMACGAVAEEICDLQLPEVREKGMKAADSFLEEDEIAEIPSSDGSYALAVDLGTTTIAVSLVDQERKRVLRTVTGINHQRAFGADVLSRIDAANRGEGKRLQKIVLDDLSSLCCRLGLDDIGSLYGRLVLDDPGSLCCRPEPDELKSYPKTEERDCVIPVFLSGNTTMEHLLQGLSCQGLGAYPFRPVDLSLHTYGNMIILPGISTYIGADIVSGIVACGMDRAEDISILIDLGTNGEMAIGNRDRILAASTAAGPAFEGGNISCGMAGVPGAIDTVEIKNGQAMVTTIGGKEASGICGSGVLELVYELLKNRLIDETGLLAEDYFEQGYPLAAGITLTIKDIREVQMAKAAIRAGIEILIRAYGISYEKVSRIYLAGSFGQKLNCEKAVGIGLLPKEPGDRIMAVGNSSLQGAAMMAMGMAGKERFIHVIEVSEEILLSNHKLFQDLYLKYMFFPELEGQGPSSGAE